MPTIHDVAEKAGVSIKTVSRVLNDPGTVKRRRACASKRPWNRSISPLPQWRACCADGPPAW
ncbi:LacI family DNA-binding transcriptional regulator [Pseudoduganella sp. UC29_106]|uniref:LacI family DNA-binding transcriptional regulator n=1 Tax=Pseudoduganella sp. UC29_106 TaxID=3374553 RepID=UPI003756A9C6